MPLQSRYAFALRSGPDRSRPYGLAASVVLHAAIVLLLLVPLLRRDFARVLTAGESLTTRSGGGGGRVAYITLPTPRAPARAPVTVTPPPATPPAIVIPTPTPPPVIPPPVPEAQVAVAAVAADSAPGADRAESGGEPGEGGGTGGGTGEGAGPGTGPGSGEHGAGRAAQLRHQVLPPENPPKELRGVELRITFLVDESGKPVRIEVDPPIQDKKFARKLTETMLSYRFRPALGPDGRPVASTFIQLVSW
jgi:hypothetical protein